jgi:N6-adenosine-specific RNA methylase IME4
LSSDVFAGLLDDVVALHRKYEVVYADPPWNSNQFGREKKRGNKRHYPLMTLDEIKALPVKELTHKNCLLFLWVVDAQLLDAGSVISAWGFKYKTIAFTWVKQTVNGKDHFGPGVWTRKNPETCLLATKGKPIRINASVRQLQKHVVREHSRKPDEIADAITQLVGNVSKIELFARYPRADWDVWGNEL